MMARLDTIKAIFHTPLCKDAPVETFTLDTANIRDITPEVLGPDQRMRVLPAAWWATTTPQERGLFGHRNGLYSFPTAELVSYLSGVISGQVAIEIGAGNGVLAQALGIPATDNFHQVREHALAYALTAQPAVPYGPNVIDCHASRAVRRFKPQVVIGCWVTRKWDPLEPSKGGNEVGVDELDVWRHCGMYVLVGNERVHADSRLWAKPHNIIYPDWVYSRAMNGSRDFVAMWHKP